MYCPFTTAKNLTGFGDEHARMMAAFPRLQMILVLACDHAVEGNRIDVARDGSPVVHYRFTAEVVDSMVAGTRAATRIFFGAGALRVHAPTARPHIIEREESGEIDRRIAAAHFLPNRTTVSAAQLMGGAGWAARPRTRLPTRGAVFTEYRGSGSLTRAYFRIRSRSIRMSR